MQYCQFSGQVEPEICRGVSGAGGTLKMKLREWLG